MVQRSKAMAGRLPSCHITLTENPNPLITKDFQHAETGVETRANPLSHKKKLLFNSLDSL
jgi:hypothetical protein